MPIEIRRFGIGNRRPQGPPGSTGVTGQVISSDASGVVAELAFARGGRVEPHANPNQVWFVVIEGGGWVQVGEDRARVAAGDAVSWPPDLVHGAWTETSEMRAIVVEFAIAGPEGGDRVIAGRAVAMLAPGEVSGTGAGTGPAAGASGGGSRADGELRADSDRTGPYDAEQGEPR